MNTEAKPARVRKGFRLSCPKCAADDGINVRAHDLAIVCTECGEEVSRSEVRTMLESWGRLLDWLEAAPER